MLANEQTHTLSLSLSLHNLHFTFCNNIVIAKYDVSIFVFNQEILMLCGEHEPGCHSVYVRR